LSGPELMPESTPGNGATGSVSKNSPVSIHFFSIPAISRQDLMSLTEECAKVTGIPYLMDAYREEAMDILGA